MTKYQEFPDEESYYLPSNPLDILVGRGEAEVYLEKESMVWKKANPDPYFQIPKGFEAKCKKFGVRRFNTQKEWIDWVEQIGKLYPLPLEITNKIGMLKKFNRFASAIQRGQPCTQ